MSWRTTKPHRRQGYHHGNLKEALVASVLNLIAQRGPAGFTMAEAARFAGVSAAAPYRHFRDREALLGEVAVRGFQRFGEELGAAWDEGRPDPRTALVRVGRAYLGFAKREPAYFSAMFHGDIDVNADPSLAKASDEAFSVLMRAAEAIALQLPERQRPPAAMLAMHFWASAHGVAVLFAGPHVPRSRLGASPDDLLEAATLIYLDGLKSPSHRV